ncbi:MAG: class I SAM-dependent methyltransferase [Polyangiales bacterium]
MTGYKEDLAYIHDVGHTDFIRRSSPGLLAILAQGGLEEGFVVNLACGSGVWAQKLVDKGFEVRGQDISPAMVKLARQRVPEARFDVSSFVDFEIPPCDAITCLGEGFNYLFDKRMDRKTLKRVFKRVWQALPSGGLFVFDVIEPGIATAPKKSYREGDDWAVLVELAEDKRHPRATRRIVSFRQVGEDYRRTEETHTLRLYKGTDLAAELREIGFRVRPVRSYGSQHFRPGHVGMVARKP